MKDEELQKSLELGQIPQGDDLDLSAYRAVFKALEKAPESGLSKNFADKIVAKVIAKRKKSESRDFFWFGVGIFCLVITFIIVFAIAAPKLHLGFLRDMSGYSGLLVFGVVFLLALNWLDKKMVGQKNSAI
jgi:hypothetical protein